MSVVLTTAAVVIAAALVHRELADSKPRQSGTVSAPTYEPRWRSLVKQGVLTGSANAPVTIVEFADLECPFCKIADSVYRETKTRYGNQIALVYVHFPIAAHRFAVPAARAAECADSLGHFDDYIATIYRQQDSLGLKSWGSYAASAGIGDTVEFNSCVRSNVNPRRIAQGRAAGQSIQVHGTPTILVNGWRFNGAPGTADLWATIDSVLAGRAPFKTVPAATGT